MKAMNEGEDFCYNLQVFLYGTVTLAFVCYFPYFSAAKFPVYYKE